MPDDELTGHRLHALGASPFAATAPAVVSAGLFGAAALVWLIAGRWLPGDRWVVIHLFTLGVLTSLITAFTRHFARVFTGQGASRGLRLPVVAAIVLDLSVVALLVGRLTHGKVLLSIGTLGLLVVVTGNLVEVVRARRRARAPRFVWVVRRYEDAHVAFLVAAVLGTLLGIGVLTGGWYFGGRDAHLHLNVLGWAGLSVLATLVVFGPTLLRARMRGGADVRAAAALRAASGGLLLAVSGLFIAGGTQGMTATVARAIATIGVASYGVAGIVVLSSLARAAWSSDRSPLRWLVIGVMVWFPTALAFDVVVVATVERALFDVVGAMLFIGVLSQLILAVFLHIAPQLRGRDLATRDALLRRTERFAITRALILNLGVLCVAAGLTGTITADLPWGASVRAGWTVVAVAVGTYLLPLVWPLGTVDPTEVRSVTAARYRDPDGDPD